jgi:hypothetical protein
MNRYNNLEIEWDRFGQEAKEAFATHGSDELREAIKYLKDNPPKKQILNSEGNLDWRLPDGINEDIKSLIDAVKRVRNNLFHGSKYPIDLERDISLINHATIVLKHLLELPSASKVKRHYYEG